MDFRDFDKAVRRGARQAEVIAEAVTPAAERAAPVYKAGMMVAIPIGSAGVLSWTVPFLAAIPAQAFLPPAISVPLFLFSQPFREGVGESIKRDTVPAATSAGVNYLFAAVLPS